MSKTIAIIDGDILAYQAATVVQKVTEFSDEVAITADKQDGVVELESRILNITKALGADDAVIALTDAENFRKAILPTYKSNRKGTPKPILLSYLRRYLVETYDAKLKPGLEGDDVMGIFLTHPGLYTGFKKIAVSIDKDLKSVPGLHFNPDKDSEPVEVSESDADHLHMMQTLTGDPADGYSGCPGCGPVKAEKALNNEKLGETPWFRAVETFQKAGLTEADALVQAQVARICRHSDYDYSNKRPIPWKPNLNS